MKLNTNCKTEKQMLEKDGEFPNNQGLPLLVYKGVLELENSDSAQSIEELFQSNGWGGTWQNGVYPFHHYHSNTHEVLGCYSGTATVQFGGPNGPRVSIGAGDVAVLPAGTSHKRIEASPNFVIVGGYPGNGDYDMCRGNPGECESAGRNIAETPVPGTDPVFGKSGGLLNLWQ